MQHHIISIVGQEIRIDPAFIYDREEVKPFQTAFRRVLDLFPPGLTTIKPKVGSTLKLTPLFFNYIGRALVDPTVAQRMQDMVKLDRIWFFNVFIVVPPVDLSELNGFEIQESNQTDVPASNQKPRIIQSVSNGFEQPDLFYFYPALEPGLFQGNTPLVLNPDMQEQMVILSRLRNLK